jgi:dihydropyrimidinase
VATSLMNVDYDLYEGEVASGSVRHTFSRGTLVYDGGEILTEPGHGRFVARSSTRTAVPA